MRLLPVPGVFRPRSDAWLLIRCVAELGAARDACALDLFTGSGVVAIASAMAGASSSTAVDVSRRATLAAGANARLNGVRVRALCGDLFAPVPGEAFDLITANPPYLPGTAGNLPRRGSARAWEGGEDGRVLVDRLCEEAGDRLRPDGRLILVQSSVTGEEETMGRLRDGGLEPAVVARRKGPLGPLLRSRASRLEAHGILAPGEREEELIVIAATRSRR
jgi:release factor glutamine methyltransferase